MKIIQIKLPNNLLEEIDAIVANGLYPNRNAFIVNAIREKINSLRADSVLVDDVKWGLYGD